MTINHIGSEEIARRKTLSDYKNNTDDLTFDGASKRPREVAYRGVRELQDKFYMQSLYDDNKYYEELLKDV